MKKIKYWSAILILIIIMWLVFCIVPFLNLNISEFTIRLMGVSFAAATALFTGIAFVAAYYNISIQQESLENQQENLIKQINLNVFSDSMRLVMDSEKYNQCREYIYSKNFKEDIAEVTKILYQEANHPISFDDFRRANQSLSRTDTQKDKDMKKRLNDSYEKIKFFCMRMEFLGVVVSRENAAEALIIDYYGTTIMDTYNILKSLIETTRGNKDSANLYMYYSELYNKVIQKRK